MDDRKQLLEKYIRILVARANASMYMPPKWEKQLNKYEAELKAIKGE